MLCPLKKETTTPLLGSLWCGLPRTRTVLPQIEHSGRLPWWSGFSASRELAALSFDASEGGREAAARWMCASGAKVSGPRVSLQLRKALGISFKVVSELMINALSKQCEFLDYNK